MSFYEATQEQRRIERRIRAAKRESVALEAAGQPTEQANRRVLDLQAKMRDFTKQTGLKRQYPRERVAKPETEQDVGFSFLSGDTRLERTKDAITLGESEEGWDKHEKIFREHYLDQFELEDDIDQTIGYWGGPEPSFNAHVTGSRRNVIRMAGAWGQDYNQQAMALLLPNQSGMGGRLIWDFGRELSVGEMDSFFKILDEVQNETEGDANDLIGVTVKNLLSIEHWFADNDQRQNAFAVINTAIEKFGVDVRFRTELGKDLLLLFKGEDY